MNSRKIFKYFYSNHDQIEALIQISRWLSKNGVFGKIVSIILDKLILTLFGLEVSSSSIDVNKLIVGHSTGVVLGGNGIRCTGTLHVSSGVVFGRKYISDYENEPPYFFDIDGDLTVGANTVILGPSKIIGPVILGAQSLVNGDIIQPGIYVGSPAKKIKDL